MGRGNRWPKWIHLKILTHCVETFGVVKPGEETLRGHSQGEEEMFEFTDGTEEKKHMKLVRSCWKHLKLVRS